MKTYVLCISVYMKCPENANSERHKEINQWLSGGKVKRGD